MLLIGQWERAKNLVCCLIKEILVNKKNFGDNLE